MDRHDEQTIMSKALGLAVSQPDTSVAFAMRAVLKTFCGCCYPKYSSVAKDGEEEGGAPHPTRVWASEDMLGVLTPLP